MWTRDPPQDYDDVLALLRVATPEDVAIAGASVDLIAERGFDRGKNLRLALDEALKKR